MLNESDVSKTSPYFKIEKIVHPSGRPATPTQYRVIHTPSSAPHLPEPGMRVMVVLKKPDAEKAIAALLDLDIDWSANQYGAPDLYAKCEPILRKYHYREPEVPRKKRPIGF